jgi:hypothetical protein
MRLRQRSRTAGWLGNPEAAAEVLDAEGWLFVVDRL